MKHVWVRLSIQRKTACASSNVQRAKCNGQLVGFATAAASVPEKNGHVLCAVCDALCHPAACRMLHLVRGTRRWSAPVQVSTTNDLAIDAGRDLVRTSMQPAKSAPLGTPRVFFEHFVFNF
jgi:hypothetical protein